MAQYAHLSVPDPEWVELCSKMPATGPPPLPYVERRPLFTQKVLANHELWDPPYPKSGLKISERSIPVEGASITIRTYVPEAKGDEESFPLLVWYHGGGFAVGDLELGDAMLRVICVNQRVSCVNVDYRLAPEHPFPIPGNDCYRATQWAAANAASLSADLQKGFIVGGDSGGANFAAVISIRARDDPSFKAKITGQVLHIPFLCPPSVYPAKYKAELLSIEQNKDDPLLTAKMMDQILVDYGVQDHSDVQVAPLLASSHANLPPVSFHICGLDVLRDEGFLYEKILRENGVPTKVEVYPGLPHGFYEAGPQMKASIKWRKDFQKGVEWLLQVK